MMQGCVLSDAVSVERLSCGDDAVCPNNQDLDVVLLRGAIVEGGAPEICALMSDNGWGGNWTYTVFDYHHYHPNAHEALAVARGWANIQLGGPSGETHRITAGDAIVLPAGTGHCRIASGDGFAICGGYPAGQEAYEIVRATGPIDAACRDEIANVPLPTCDPIFGDAGPLCSAWAL